MILNLNKWRGEAAILFAALFYSLAAVLVKKASLGLNGFQISFIRFLIGAILIILSMTLRGNKIRIIGYRDWVLRGVFGCISMVLLYVAIGMIGSGRGILLSDTFPIFVVIYGFIFFKQKIVIRNILAICLCIPGAFLIYHANGSANTFGYILALVAAMFSGIAVQFLKRLREFNSSFMVYLSPCIFGLLVTAYSVPGIFSADGRSLITAAAVGVLTFVGQVVMSYGFKYTTAASGSIMTLAEIPLILFISTFAGESYTLIVLAGALLVVIGLIVNSLDINLIIKKITGRTVASAK